MKRIIILLSILISSYCLCNEENQEREYNGQTMFVPALGGLGVLINQNISKGLFNLRYKLWGYGGGDTDERFSYVELTFGLNILFNKEPVGFYSLIEGGPYWAYQKENTWDENLYGVGVKTGAGYLWKFSNNVVISVELGLPIPIGGFKVIDPPVGDNRRYPIPQIAFYIGWQY